MGSIRSLIIEILLISAALAAAAAAAALIFLDSPQCDAAAAPGWDLSLVRPDDLDLILRVINGSYNVLDGVSGGRALCVEAAAGQAVAAIRRLGFRDAVGAAATACCGLPFAAGSFDFVLAAAVDRARVPARVVLEMERVLRPGRAGAVIRLRSGSARPGGLMRAAAPVASLLRLSDVVGARAVNGSAVVVFKKRGGGSPVAGAGCGAEITEMPPLFDAVIELAKAAIVVLKGLSSK